MRRFRTTTVRSPISGATDDGLANDRRLTHAGALTCASTHTHTHVLACASVQHMSVVNFRSTDAYVQQEFLLRQLRFYYERLSTPRNAQTRLPDQFWQKKQMRTPALSSRDRPRRGGIMHAYSHTDGDHPAISRTVGYGNTPTLGRIVSTSWCNIYGARRLAVAPHPRVTPPPHCVIQRQ